MGKTISDVIEEFIKSSLDSDDFIELSRNDLAKFFECVPSQINYVLNTRFTINNGFVIESQRGGGGYIKVTRVRDNDNNFLSNALELCDSSLNVMDANKLLTNMLERKLITASEYSLIKSAISPKALNNPLNMDNKLRASILGQVIIELMKKANNKNK